MFFPIALMQRKLFYFFIFIFGEKLKQIVNDVCANKRSGIHFLHTHNDLVGIMKDENRLWL